MQSRRMSLFETATVKVVGFFVSVCGNLFLLPRIGLPVDIWQSIGISAFFAVIAIPPSFIIRRIFNGLR